MIVSSNQSGRKNANAYFYLPFALGRHVIRTGAQIEEGGWRRRILGYRMDGTFFECSEVVSVANESEKKNVKKKKRKGDKGNTEEGKNIPLDDIYANAEMTIRSVHLDRKCD